MCFWIHHYQQTLGKTKRSRIIFSCYGTGICLWRDSSGKGKVVKIRKLSKKLRKKSLFYVKFIVSTFNFSLNAIQYCCSFTLQLFRICQVSRIEHETHALFSLLTQKKGTFYLWQNRENWPNWGILLMKRIKMFTESYFWYIYCSNPLTKPGLSVVSVVDILSQGILFNILVSKFDVSSL